MHQGFFFSKVAKRYQYLIIIQDLDLENLMIFWKVFQTISILIFVEDHSAAKGKYGLAIG